MSHTSIPELYGSRPDQLPKNMIEGKSAQHVKKLSWEENKDLSDKSLNLFPISSSSIDWCDITPDIFIYYKDEEELVDCLRTIILQKSKPDSPLVCFGDSLDIPTVEFPVRLLDEYLEGIVSEVFVLGTWFYLPHEDYFIECLNTGEIRGIYLQQLSLIA